MKVVFGYEGREKTFITRPDLVSFVVYDHRSLPVILGVEYRLAAGIARTFSTVAEDDFYTTLQRSGLDQIDPAGMVHGKTHVRIHPYLGRGIPEWLTGMTSLLVINDFGKHLFFAYRDEAGVFHASLCNEPKFEQFVGSFF
jgi:hypothetical protein